jgi:CheY-like chemotaxis protein
MKPAPLIILIEDNPADVLLFQMAMKNSGLAYSLQQFESGMDAVQVLCGPEAQGSLAPDAILLDLKTPRTDGFDVLVKLKQTPRLSQVPIAILTSSRARSDKHRAELHGARYIEKPSQLQEFVSSVGQAVKEMLSQSQSAA